MIFRTSSLQHIRAICSLGVKLRLFVPEFRKRRGCSISSLAKKLHWHADSLQDVYAFQALRVLVLGVHRSGLTESKLQRGVENRGTHAYSLLLQAPCAAYDMPIPDGLYKSQMRKTKCLSMFPTVLWTHKLKQGPSDRTPKSLRGCRFLESALS